MTSLIMASGTFMEKSVFTSFFRSYCLSPLFYPMRPTVIAKGPSQEHVNIQQDGFPHCVAEKSEAKVKSTSLHFRRLPSGVDVDFFLRVDFDLLTILRP